MADNSPKPSELFEECFRDNTGTLTSTCELCGVTIFCTLDVSSYETEELDRLTKAAKEDPKKYIEWADCNGVSLGWINGQLFIMDHECPELAKYEQFVWRNRFAIAEYLQKRAKEELDAKTEQAARIGVLNLPAPEDEGIRRSRPGDFSPAP